MKKTWALEQFGDSVAEVAAAVGVTSSAVTQWPEDLPRRIADRVVAAIARKHLPPELLGADVPPIEAVPAGQEGATHAP